jgi:2-hydroxymuconate-semialdehyde hydrolase
MDDVEQFVIEYLRSRSVTRSVSEALDGESRLMELGVLDSLGLMSLVSHVEQAYGFTLPDADFVPENFETPRSITTMIKRLSARSK